MTVAGVNITELERTGCGARLIYNLGWWVTQSFAQSHIHSALLFRNLDGIFASKQVEHMEEGALLALYEASTKREGEYCTVKKDDGFVCDVNPEILRNHPDLVEKLLVLREIIKTREAVWDTVFIDASTTFLGHAYYKISQACLHWMLEKNYPDAQIESIIEWGLEQDRSFFLPEDRVKIREHQGISLQLRDRVENFCSE